jgi:hypothetical protein
MPLSSRRGRSGKPLLTIHNTLHGNNSWPPAHTSALHHSLHESKNISFIPRTKEPDAIVSEKPIQILCPDFTHQDGPKHERFCCLQRDSKSRGQHHSGRRRRWRFRKDRGKEKVATWCDGSLCLAHGTFIPANVGMVKSVKVMEQINHSAFQLA